MVLSKVNGLKGLGDVEGAFIEALNRFMKGLSQIKDRRMLTECVKLLYEKRNNGKNEHEKSGLIAELTAYIDALETQKQTGIMDPLHPPPGLWKKFFEWIKSVFQKDWIWRLLGVLGNIFGWLRGCV